MPEYIDRESLLKEAESRIMWGMSEQAIYEAIQETPTADVVSVVRCKDCIHRIFKDMGGEIGEIGGCEIFNVALPCDFYCSYGERKEGAG